MSNKTRVPFLKVIKVYTQVQLNLCKAIRETVFVQEQKVPLELEHDEHDQLEDSSAQHYLLVEDGMPIGTARWVKLEDGSIKIQRFAILSLARGKGYGKVLLDAMEADTQASRYVLGAQAHAIGFYERCGYTVISDTFLDAGIPHKTMEKIVKAT